MKIGNILQNIRECGAYEIDDKDENPGDNLFEEAEAGYVCNKKRERAYWTDMPADFLESMKEDKRQRD